MTERSKPVSLMVDPLTILSRNYDSDLRVLRNLRPSTLSPLDINTLRSMVIKYCTDKNQNLCDMQKYSDKVFKGKFFIIKGELEGEIQERLENLTRVDYLESMRDRMPSKRPRQVNPKVGRVPKELLDEDEEKK